MSMPVSAGQIVWLLVAHYVGDYILQSRWMANNKSKRLDALALHVGIYTATLAALTLPFLYNGWQGWLTFVIVNGFAHFVTDYCTSRTVAHLWSEKREYETFAVMGADQLCHQMVLIGTAWLLVQP